MSAPLPIKTLLALMIGCIVSRPISAIAGRVLHTEVRYMQAGMVFVVFVSTLAVRQNYSVVMSAVLKAARLTFAPGGWAMFAFGAILFVAGHVLATKRSDATFAASMFCLAVVGLSIFHSLQTVILASRHTERGQ